MEVSGKSTWGVVVEVDCVGDAVDVVMGMKAPSAFSLPCCGLLMTVLPSSLLTTPPRMDDDPLKLGIETVDAKDEF